MSPPSRKNKESEAHAPLSSRMLDLLALIITAIDLRRDIIDVPPEPGYRAETCLACSGTGHLMVPVNEDQDPEDDESYVDGGLDDDDDDDNDNAPRPSTNGLASEATDFGTVAAAPLGLASSGGCSAGPSASVDPSSSAAANAVAGPSSGAGTFGAIPSGPSGTPAGAGAVSFNPPAPVVPISGIHPLPAGTPIPTPDQAVYANADAARYYTVTRGLRVGVFEGWPRVSPYVTGVQRAVYSRHRTLQEAYDAYCIAYAHGAVRYA
ncbi:hypothetical protein MD484_g6554, partial [Candolleomyces efflorescens]